MNVTKVVTSFAHVYRSNSMFSSKHVNKGTKYKYVLEMILSCLWKHLFDVVRFRSSFGMCLKF